MKKKETRGRKRKLTPLEEIMVFDLYQKGETRAEIAYQFKISDSTVGRIVREKKKERE